MAEEFLSDDLTPSSPQTAEHQREKITHVLVGSRRTVEFTINKLTVLGYCERHQWSKLQPPGNLGEMGEVMSILVRYPIFESQS